MLPAISIIVYATQKSFNELFWKCKDISLKKFKIIAEPVAAMASGGPAAGDGRQVPAFGLPLADQRQDRLWT